MGGFFIGPDSSQRKSLKFDTHVIEIKKNKKKKRPVYECYLLLENLNPLALPCIYERSSRLYMQGKPCSSFKDPLPPVQFAPVLQASSSHQESSRFFRNLCC